MPICVGMRATRGLMASMGAATCLILAGTLVLTLLSGVIAFSGWPGVGPDGSGEQGALVARVRAEAAVKPTGRLRLPSAQKALASVRASSAATTAGATRQRAAVRRTTGVATHGTTRIGATGLPSTTAGPSTTAAAAPQAPIAAARAGEPVRRIGGAVTGTVNRAGKTAGAIVEPIVPGAGALVGQVTGAVGQAVTGATGAVGRVVDGLGPKP
jgi:hypothetical protein